MFLSWCLLNGLAGELHLDDFPETLEALKARKITPGEFLIKACDEKFTDEDLSEEGNAFTVAYFDFKTGNYLGDYEDTLLLPGRNVYSVPDTWETYDKLAPIIERRYKEWKKNG